MCSSSPWKVLAFLMCLAAATGTALFAQSGVHGQDGASVDRSRHQRAHESSLTTLYGLDPIARTMNFTDGAYGGVIQDHEVKNAQSDIDFNCYLRNGFTVGIEGGREGAIVDLGPSRELGERFGFSETVGRGQGFTSIRFVDGTLQILADSSTQATQPIPEAASLVPSGGKNSAPVKVGHAYLVRIVDKHDPQFELVAKLLVVEFRPGESVTIRWERLK